MAYRLEQEEAPAEGIRRCAGEELDFALEQLTGQVAEDPATAVHEARKSLKKERALLRLVRDSLDRDAYRAENEALRDAGRELSGVRDAEVMLQTLDDLAERYVGRVPKATFSALRRTLAAERRRARRRSLSDGAGVERVAEKLIELRRRVDDWPLEGSDWTLVGGGLERAYRRGRSAFRTARDEPTAENLHEWRKRVKDLWYHLRLLEPLWPQVMQAGAGEAHALSELLGDDHDLAVLRERLMRSEVDAEPPVDLEPLIEALDGRREQLQAQALLLGKRLYSERPKAFLRRMRRLWEAWEAEAGAPEPTAA